MNYLLAFLFIIFLASCGDVKKDTQLPTAIDSSAFLLDPRLQQADSLVVVYYDDPFGADSLRYTRFYKQVSLTDTSSLNQLKQQLAHQFTFKEFRKDCRSEGKIWVYEKGKIFQTLYFNSKVANCRHIYLIRDGNFYYSEIIPGFIEWLSRKKPHAIDPS